jgi:hypothetical protein
MCTHLLPDSQFFAAKLRETSEHTAMFFVPYDHDYKYFFALKIILVSLIVKFF